MITPSPTAAAPAHAGRKGEPIAGAATMTPNTVREMGCVDHDIEPMAAGRVLDTGACCASTDTQADAMANSATMT